MKSRPDNNRAGQMRSERWRVMSAQSSQTDGIQGFRSFSPLFTRPAVPTHCALSTPHSLCSPYTLPTLHYPLESEVHPC